MKYKQKWSTFQWLRPENFLEEQDFDVFQR